MMEELIDLIVTALNSDGELAACHVAAWCRDFTEDNKLNARNKGITAEVFSLGFSQTEGAGTLQPYYYFGVVLRDKEPLLRKYNNMGQNIDSAAERIVSMLHGHQYAGLNVMFSKAIRLYERHTVELNTRRLTLDVADGELAEGIFFYASNPAHAHGASLMSAASEGGVIYIGGDGIWD